MERKIIIILIACTMMTGCSHLSKRDKDGKTGWQLIAEGIAKDADANSNAKTQRNKNKALNSVYKKIEKNAKKENE